MSSEFSAYFEEFLNDEFNEFDLFKGDFSGIEPSGEHQGDNLPLQDGAVNGFDPTISEDLKDPSLAVHEADHWAGRPALLPETNLLTGRTTEGELSAGIVDPASVMMDSLGEPLQNSASPSPSPCPWIPCSTSSTIRTESETTAHLEDHWGERLRQWPALKTCGWPNCQSRATFKSPSSLRSHIFNIHVTPLVCTHSQCTYTRPFGKQYELNRHINTVHAASQHYKCPVESCEAHTTGFARKDKLLNHTREQHENLRCPYNHCFATVLETQQELHLQQFHGSFECALGACNASPASCFLEEDLQRHLRKHHNLTYDPVLSVMRTLTRTGDNIARLSHIVTFRGWQDCLVCSQTQNASFTMQDAGGNSSWNEERVP